MRVSVPITMELAPPPMSEVRRQRRRERRWNLILLLAAIASTWLALQTPTLVEKAISNPPEWFGWRAAQ